MAIKVVFITLALVILAACSGQKPGAANMALACQTTPCACVSENKSLLRKDKIVDVLWKINGDAFCPKGFALEKTAEK